MVPLPSRGLDPGGHPAPEPGHVAEADKAGLHDVCGLDPPRAGDHVPERPRKLALKLARPEEDGHDRAEPRVPHRPEPLHALLLGRRPCHHGHGGVQEVHVHAAGHEVGRVPHARDVPLRQVAPVEEQGVLQDDLHRLKQVNVELLVVLVRAGDRRGQNAVPPPVLLEEVVDRPQLLLDDLVPPQKALAVDGAAGGVVEL
mmetsp:Transcript_23961/g.57109  ORF Transcript_23961/g.57109 Transcript_23961/m.57109 type:complete len:200 (+) Transcript_23961:88-687(+)